jgi:hypothetical protein
VFHSIGDSDYVISPTVRRKCGAERAPFSVEGSSTVPSQVRKIKFERRGRAQERGAQKQCASHLVPIFHRTGL